MTLVAADPLDDLAVALARLDEVALRLAASKALRRNEGERHDSIDDLAVVYAALVTHRRLHTEELP
jgi:hypothetical protein